MNARSRLSEAVLYVHTGDENGTRPRLATVKASAMVARGAESALPTIVRRSRVIPNVESSRIADSTKDVSPCKAALLANSEVGNLSMGSDVSVLDGFGLCRCDEKAGVMAVDAFGARVGEGSTNEVAEG